MISAGLMLSDSGLSVFPRHYKTVRKDSVLRHKLGGKAENCRVFR